MGLMGLSCFQPRALFSISVVFGQQLAASTSAVLAFPFSALPSEVGETGELKPLDFLGAAVSIALQCSSNVLLLPQQ